MILITVPVQAALIVFTINAFDPLITFTIRRAQLPVTFFLLYKFMVFVVVQYILFLCISAINALIPNEVDEIQVVSERTSAVISSLTLIDAEAYRAYRKEKMELSRLREEVRTVAELRQRVDIDAVRSS